MTVLDAPEGCFCLLKDEVAAMVAADAFPRSSVEQLQDELIEDGFIEPCPDHEGRWRVGERVRTLVDDLVADGETHPDALIQAVTDDVIASDRERYG